MCLPAVNLWYLPPGIATPPSTEQNGARRLTRIDAGLVHATLATLDAAAPALRSLSTNEIIAAIDQALGRWQDGSRTLRQALLTHGAAQSGFSVATVKYAIDTMLNQFRTPELKRLLEGEFDADAVLDTGRALPDGLVRRAYGPGRQFHVFAGTVPTVPIFSLICALLVKSPVLAKPSHHDPFFAALFAQTLAEVEPRLACALAVLPWPGGETVLEDAALHGAGAVVVYGSDETVNGYRARTRAGVRFLGYGHRLSAAAVAGEALRNPGTARSVARSLAWDVALFDQRGCLSPQFALVEAGGVVPPAALANAVAKELDRLSRRLPRGPVDADTAARIQSIREHATFQAALGREVRLWHSADSTNWTVILRRDAEELAGCGNRTLTLLVVENLDHDLPRICRGMPLSTIGVAAPQSRLPSLISAWGQLATRYCRIGRMGEPPVTWRHDGRPNLSDLVTWVDVERLDAR